MLIRADFHPSFRLARPVIAVASGSVIGVLIQELVWILLDALTPSTGLDTTLYRASGGSTLLLALILSWFVGGFGGGLMAGLVGGGRWAAHLTGGLLCAAAILLLWFAWAEPGAASAWMLGLTPLPGALLGGWLAQGLMQSRQRPQRSGHEDI